MPNFGQLQIGSLSDITCMIPTPRASDSRAYFGWAKSAPCQLLGILLGSNPRNLRRNWSRCCGIWFRRTGAVVSPLLLSTCLVPRERSDDGNAIKSERLSSYVGIVGDAACHQKHGRQERDQSRRPSALLVPC